jgi:hypothetical protein
VNVSSPKNHAQPVGLPVDASVNATVKGTVPETGVPLNAATGAAVTLETQRQKTSIPVIPQIRPFNFITERPVKIKYFDNNYFKNNYFRNKYANSYVSSLL